MPEPGYTFKTDGIDYGKDLPHVVLEIKISFLIFSPSLVREINVKSPFIIDYSSRSPSDSRSKSSLEKNYTPRGTKVTNTTKISQ